MVLGLGSWEVMLIGLALIVLFGPEHVPRAMRTLGRWQAKARSTVRELEDTIEREAREPIEYPQLEPVDGPIPPDRD